MISSMLKWVDSKPYTRNLVPDDSTYWEVQRKIGGIEFRYWNPDKSKLSAFLMKGGKIFPFDLGSNILYLGAASGTTVGHISDICTDGRIFAVEVAKNPFRKLLNLAEKRPNIVPILEDANQPDIYSRLVGQVDILYQDIAQRNQTDIFIKNAFMLKPGGTGYLMVKSRCIDVSAAPTKIFNECRLELEGAGFKVLEMIRLEPHEKDHMAIVVEK